MDLYGYVSCTPPYPTRCTRWSLERIRPGRTMFAGYPLSPLPNEIRLYPGGFTFVFNTRRGRQRSSWFSYVSSVYGPIQ
ncbi:M5 [Myxoma virus]|uniref:M5 n=2 Tax=Myxoma virus TaxID=10273 RepID=A0A481ND19_9POXV|nr:m5 [Myxoma virus]QAV34472.1 M5 [Myxoma virus]QAV34655.1 m5 [Myxoma virus]QAV34810.1 M5 [Myxoma virus]QAV34824.1 m5 [Myxoma virus]